MHLTKKFEHWNFVENLLRQPQWTSKRPVHPMMVRLGALGACLGSGNALFWPRHATTEGCTPRALPNGPFRCPFGFALVMNQWGLTWSPGRGLERHVHSSTARGGSRPDHSWSKTFLFPKFCTLFRIPR